MRKDSVVFGVAGIFFGLLVGWIIGSQQAAPARPRPLPRGAPRRSPGAGRRRRSTRPCCRPARRRPRATRRTPTRRVQLGNLYFDAERFADAVQWYEEAVQHRPRDVNASTDLGISYYYTNQPDRALGAVRPLAGDRSEALEDPAEHRHRPRVRQAGSRRRREGVPAGASTSRPASPEARAAKQALEGIRSAHPDSSGGESPKQPGLTGVIDAADPSARPLPADCPGRADARARRRARVERRPPGAYAAATGVGSSCAIRCAACTSRPSNAMTVGSGAGTAYFCSEKCRQAWRQAVSAIRIAAPRGHRRGRTAAVRPRLHGVERRQHQRPPGRRAGC